MAAYCGHANLGVSTCRRSIRRMIAASDILNTRTASVMHCLRADLDDLVMQRGQGPVLHGLGQGWITQEVAKVVCQGEVLQTVPDCQ